jgi:hypothetical protein
MSIKSYRNLLYHYSEPRKSLDVTSMGLIRNILIEGDVKSQSLQLVKQYVQ